MDKTYIIKFKNINKEYREDVEGNLQELFSNVVEFAQEIEIEESD